MYAWDGERETRCALSLRLAWSGSFLFDWGGVGSEESGSWALRAAKDAEDAGVCTAEAWICFRGCGFIFGRMGLG